MQKAGANERLEAVYANRRHANGDQRSHNATTYLPGQSVLAINTDPHRVDGVAFPYAIEDAAQWVARGGAAQAHQAPPKVHEYET